MITPATRRLLSVLLPLFTACLAPADEGRLGLFDGQADIGAPKRGGTAAYQAATDAYTVGGGGENMWFKADSFHFVWKKVEGDVAIEADIAFPQAGGNAHRKGVLMIRQSLAPDSAYADAALHGDGLTSLQFREAAGEVTHEVQAVSRNPSRLRLEKAGDTLFLSLAGSDGVVKPSGSAVQVRFGGPVYVGLGVCAHDENAFETAVFSKVVVGPVSSSAAVIRSAVEYVKVPSGDRVCVYPSPERITAAAWATDGALHFAQAGRTFQVPVTGGAAEPADAAALPAGQTTAPSPDGKWLATLEHKGGEAILALTPAAGGEARILMRLPDQAEAPAAISWSPDSTKIAYVRHQPGRK